MPKSSTPDQPLAIFDLDGTLFRWQLYYEVVLKLLERDFFSAEQAAEIRRAFHGWQSRTEAFHNFEVIAIDALTAHLPVLRVDEFSQIVGEVLDESSHKVYSYTRELAKKLKRDGYHLLAISGSMQEIAEPFALEYGFDACIGWLYERNGDYFTGNTTRVTVGRKGELIREYAKKHGFSFVRSIAIGDSKGDLEMLELVETPIAFNPNDELLEIAKNHGWRVVIERKNVAYTLEKGNDGSFVLAKTDVY